MLARLVLSEMRETTPTNTSDDRQVRRAYEPRQQEQGVRCNRTSAHLHAITELDSSRANGPDDLYKNRSLSAHKH